MSIFYRIFFLMFLFGYSALLAKGETRTWTRDSDAKKVEADFISADLDNDKIELLLKSGKPYTMPLSSLSQNDQEWVKQFFHQKEEAEKTLLSIKAESEKLQIEGAKIATCHIRYPARITPAQREDCTLCILYQPNGDSDRMVSHLSKTADELGWILVGVDAYSNKRVLANMSQVLNDSRKAVDEILKTIPHDSEKVIFGGLSGGAWWSYLSTAEIHNDAAAVIAFGGWMSEQYNRDYPRGLKIAMVNGDKDPACDWEEPDGEFLQKKKKATVKVFHFPGGHTVAPSEVITEAGRWLSDQIQAKK